MSRAKLIARTLLLSVLGLVGVALLLEGLWFVWQGGPMQGVLMVVTAGGMLAGCAGWLLFFAPPQPITVHEVAAAPCPSSRPQAEEASHVPIRIPTRYQRFREELAPELATPDELRAALAGIGMRRIAGATWQEAAGDERWANLCVFLHCERDKLGESSDDVDGLYLTREEAEAAVSVSPQADRGYVWKVFVAAVALQYIIDDRKALPHLVRAIKKELLGLPAGECPGTPVELRNLFGGKAWLDTDGRHVVLFEDEGSALDGPMFSEEPQTGAFKTDSGVGLFDESGAIVLPPRFEDIQSFYSGLAAAKQQGFWGFVDHNDHWQIEPRFLELEVLPFYDDDKEYARARTENGWGIIDRKGRWILADRYAEIGSTTVRDDSELFAAVRKEANGLWGCVMVNRHPGVVIDSVSEHGNELAIDLVPSAYKETLVVDYVWATEEEIEPREIP